MLVADVVRRPLEVHVDPPATLEPISLSQTWIVRVPPEIQRAVQRRRIRCRNSGSDAVFAHHGSLGREQGNRPCHREHDQQHKRQTISRHIHRRFTPMSLQITKASSLAWYDPPRRMSTLAQTAQYRAVNFLFVACSRLPDTEAPQFSPTRSRRCRI